MKKLILLLLFVLFISIAACSQTITEQIVKYVPITEAQRDGLSPPSNQRWKIFNSTTGVFEYWNGTSWTIFSGGGGSSTLNGLSDVTLTSPANGQVLTYNGTNWINQSIAGTGDMLKSIYDTNDDGVVDNSATLGGQIPNFYLDNTDTQNPLSDNIATTSSTVSASSTAVKSVNDKANANTSAILTKEDDLGNPSTNGYVLSSLTDGTRSWIANGVGGGGGLSNVVEDATPQLGGDLDLNGYDIPEVYNGKIGPSVIISNYALTASDAGLNKIIECNANPPVPQVLTINNSIFTTGQFITLWRAGVSSVQIVPGTGVTFKGFDDGSGQYFIHDQYSSVTLFCESPSVFRISGNLTVPSSGSINQSANYNWTGNHTFIKKLLLGDGTDNQTRIKFNDANANNSYIDVKSGEFSFNAWHGGVFKNVFNASISRFNLTNSTIASIDAGTNKHVVTKEYTDANYATIADFVAGQVTALNVGNKSGTTYWTPQTATAFTTTGITQGGIVHVICNTSGMSNYPTLDGNAPSIQSPTFVAGEHTMTIISYDGINVEHFFTKN